MESQLNQGSANAANNVTNWSGTCYITPLLGAFIADAYFGRFWTIASFMIVYILVSFFYFVLLLMFSLNRRENINKRYFLMF
jgi:dipeptide/tripeptide permease